MAKKKKGYKKGGVVGTSEFSEHSYEKGGVVGTAEYSKRKYKKGGIAKPKFKDGGIVKRKGWGDKEGSKGSYKNSADHSYDGKAYGSRKGWGDKEGSKGSYSQRGGSAQNSDKFKKRRGYSDHGVEHAYEDGGIVRQARLDALESLHDQMSDLSSGSLNAYKDGGVVQASVLAKDKKGLKKGLSKAAELLGEQGILTDKDKKKYEDGGIVESDEGYEEDSDGYNNLSKEDLLKLLRNQ